MKMKTKVALVLLLALLVVPAAVANSVDYDTGTFSSGMLSGSFSTMINVAITGSLHSIDIQTGTLVKSTAGCPAGSSCFTFSGGTVTVDGTVFKDSLNGGVTITAKGAATISAFLMPEAGVTSGTASASFDFSGLKLTSGSEDVAFNTTSAVPEPSSLSLLMLGCGLIPVALGRNWWIRRA